jgi:hypothetical protein
VRVVGLETVRCTIPLTKKNLRVASAALLIALFPAVPGSPAEPRTDSLVTRVSYWSTRPGKTGAAHAFWKRFTPIFEEMKTKGLLDEWLFVTPEIHTGEHWDLAYVWRCHDWTTYGEADQYFSDAVARMDGDRIEADIDAAFDGTNHRDEIWEAAGPDLSRPKDAPSPDIFLFSFFRPQPGQNESARTMLTAGAAVLRELQAKDLILEYHFITPSLHTGQDWEIGVFWGVKDMKTYGAAVEAFNAAMDAGDSPRIATMWNTSLWNTSLDLEHHHDALWKRVEIK